MNNTNNVIDIMDGPSFYEMMGTQRQLYIDLVNELGLKVG